MGKKDRQRRRRLAKQRRDEEEEENANKVNINEEKDSKQKQLDDDDVKLEEKAPPNSVAKQKSGIPIKRENTKGDEIKKVDSQLDIRITAQITTQLNRMMAIQRVYDQMARATAEEATPSELDIQESTVKDHWKYFSSYHETLVASSPQEFFLSDYIADDMFGQTSTLFDDTIGVIGRLRSMVKTKVSSDNGNNSNALARIPIKSFDGSYSDYRPFADLFLSLTENTPSIQRFARLKGALRGEPYEMIKNLGTTGKNFDVAWKMLEERYDNNRLINQSHVSRLFSLQPLTEASAKGLMYIVDTIKEALEALKALGDPVEKWNSLMKFQVKRLLDTYTRQQWEVETGAAKEVQPLADLLDFILSMARALENVEGEEKITNQKTSSSGGKNKSAKVNHATAAPDTRGAGAQQQHKGSTTNGGGKTSVCALCRQPHFVMNCKSFQNMNATQRRELVKNQRICYNCLNPHSARNCRQTTRCKQCGGKHHTMLHIGSPGDTTHPQHDSSYTQQQLPPKGSTASPTSSPNDVTDDGGNSSSSTEKLTTATLIKTSVENFTGNTSITAVHHSAAADSSEKHSSDSTQRLVLLATALAKAHSPQGFSHVARILIDQGSELSFVSERLVHILHLQRKASVVNLIGIGNTESGHTRGIVSLELESTYNSTQRVIISAHILGKLTARLPTISCQPTSIGELQHLQLADKSFIKPGPVDIIIGADYYGQIIGEKIIKSTDNQLVGQQTLFGWIISGPVCCSGCSTKVSLTAVRESSNEQLLAILRRFWTQEELPSSSGSSLNPDELECELHFQKTHARDNSGRYIIRLPLKTSASALGESKQKALRLLKRIGDKIKTNPDFGRLYKDFISEYEALGHMKRTSDASEPTLVYYLPHHGVLRPDSSTTKLRVVFNGSSRTSTGISLNDILHSGGKLQIDTSDVLFWLRKHRWVFGTDIVKMFRQVKVHEDDWDLQRIVWRDENDQLVTFQLTTVTYGQSCAPWLALRVIQQLTKDEGHRFPLAVPSLTKGRYVDDIYGGADTEEELKQIIPQLIGICTAGGLPLQKWTSNSPRTLQELGLAAESSSAAVHFDDEVVKVLGLCWNPRSDTFQYRTNISSTKVFTKRTVLSEIAQIYDPLGFISPVIVRAKIFIQELWHHKLGWDDPLPLSFIKRWTEFRDELSQLSNISVPRWIQLTTAGNNVQLHGFADASNLAMGAVVYLRTVINDSAPVITLLCAKTRVAPLKRMTIPRLELTAALLLTELVVYAQRMLEVENIKIFMWTDSSVALAWINGHHSRWKDFVQNRVLKIQEALPNAEWLHISGTDNPADCASRGVSPAQLKNHPLWWNGPQWLTLPLHRWPTSEVDASSQAAIEEKPTSAHPVVVEEFRDEFLEEFIERHNSLRLMIGVSAMVIRAAIRFSNLLRRRRGEVDLPITYNTIFPHRLEFEQARIFWLKRVQNQYFGEEIRILSNGQDLPNTNSLSRLTPFLDEHQVLRLGGRLQNTLLHPDEIHPAIIPRYSRFSALAIDDAHKITLHGGTQLTLSYIRQKYWIIGGRAPVS